jgi:hypothetical protein
MGKPKPDVVFRLNENLAQTKSTNESDDKIPIEHKLVMIPYLGNQGMYILKQTEETNQQKESLSIIGKVTQRAECTPATKSATIDLKYLEMKK